MATSVSVQRRLAVRANRLLATALRRQRLAEGADRVADHALVLLPTRFKGALPFL
jgi:hypothetical protein